MADIKVKSRKSGRMAYIEHVGSYSTIPFDVLINKLYAWAKANRARPGFTPLTIYPDDPNTTPAEQLRSWVAIPIAGDAADAGEVRILEMPETTVAVYRHEAPASEYGNSYNRLREWAASEGYEFTGPPLEIYYKKPREKKGQLIIYAEIQFPVIKK